MRGLEKLRASPSPAFRNFQSQICNTLEHTHTHTHASHGSNKDHAHPWELVAALRSGPKRGVLHFRVSVGP